MTWAACSLAPCRRKPTGGQHPTSQPEITGKRWGCWKTVLVHVNQDNSELMGKTEFPSHLFYFFSKIFVYLFGGGEKERETNIDV